MPHLFRGQWVDDQGLVACLAKLPLQIQADIGAGVFDSFTPDLVLRAVDRLSKSRSLGILIADAPAYVMAAVDQYLSASALEKKIQRELGEGLGQWLEVAGPGGLKIEERLQALGVLLHIGAGNAIALSALSVLEGLLCGNINILKLPAYEDGLSLKLLVALVELEPLLAPYIYAFDIRSVNRDALGQLGAVADAAVVWGSDEAIAGLRQLAPAHLPLIEWGHRLSFAYVTEGIDMEGAMGALAHEIWETDQLFCNSPQCLFVEGGGPLFYKEVGRLLFDKLTALKVQGSGGQSNQGLSNHALSIRAIDLNSQAEITWVRSLVKAQAALDQTLIHQGILEDPDREFSVLLQGHSALMPSPLYRNIWVMPIGRHEVLEVLRPHKGHLQTVGLACDGGDYEVLSTLFFRAGLQRIRPMGDMMGTYVGEPHDGKVTLLQYTRRVSRVSKVSKV